MSAGWLLDTHALVFWHQGEILGDDFRGHLDGSAREGKLFVSSVSFWETALLVKKGRLALPDVAAWKDDILTWSGARLLEPDVDAMIASVALPDHHRDPFDRLLIAQAIRHDLALVSRDALLHAYPVLVAWETTG